MALGNSVNPRTLKSNSFAPDSNAFRMSFSASANAALGSSNWYLDLPYPLQLNAAKPAALSRPTQFRFHSAISLWRTQGPIGTTGFVAMPAGPAGWTIARGFTLGFGPVVVPSEIDGGGFVPMPTGGTLVLIAGGWFDGSLEGAGRFVSRTVLGGTGSGG